MRRRSARPRRACSAGWPPSGAGGPSAAAEGKPTDRPNMVCGPVQVVWHKFASYWDIEIREVPMSPGHYGMDADDDAGAGRREHDHGRADLRRHLHRRLRAGEGRSPTPSTSCRPTPGSTSTSTSTAPAARSSRRSARPTSSWTSGCPRVKSISTSGHKFGLAPLGVGWVVWRDAAGAARRPDLPRQLPGRRHAGVPDQLLPPGRPDRRAVLRLPAPRAARATGASTWPPTTPASTSPREIVEARAVRAALRQRPGDRDPDRHVADRARARTPATRCSTSPTGCACGAGRCPRTR